MKTVAPQLKGQDQIAMGVCTVSDSAHDLSGGKVFLPSYSVEVDAAFNAQQMWQMGVKKAVVLFLDNEFSRSHEEAFRKGFQGQGVLEDKIGLRTVEEGRFTPVE